MMHLTMAFAAACLILASGTGAAAFECTVCHSKKPGMVKMHQALQGRGCFDCHKVGAKLMGKAQPTDTESLLARRVTDPLCVECHSKVPERRPG